MSRTHQRVVVVFVAGRHFAIRSLPVTDSGYAVECGMVGVLADHAVGVGEMVEEAGGWIVPVSYTHLDVYKRQTVHVLLQLSTRVVPCVPRAWHRGQGKDEGRPGAIWLLPESWE